MIVSAKNISLPYSGVYKERIYDGNENYHFNSQEWCFVEFTNDDYSVWCGHFRGEFKALTIFEKNSFILVLTSDYFYKLDKNTGDLIALTENLMYEEATSAPNGDIIISDSYNIEKITENDEQILIESPIQMDSIEFKGWEGHLLKFECYEFLNWQNYFEMIYNNETNQISIIKRK